MELSADQGIFLPVAVGAMMLQFYGPASVDMYFSRQQLHWCNAAMTTAI
jgi:hypothetical protein